jgi:PPM family protein phosphatase
MVRFLSFTEAGGHPKNEDAFEVQCHPSDPACWLCFLADGQGGQAGGAPAARLACRTGMEAACLQRPDRLRDVAAWPALLRRADNAVRADSAAGYCTLLGFCIWAGALAGASAGDSAVLAVTGDGAPRELTAGQAKNPPVGSGAAQFLPFAAKLSSPWAVLAMSDGVWKYIGWERLVEAVSTLRGEALLAALQDAARLRASGRFPDDFTVVLFEEQS